MSVTTMATEKRQNWTKRAARAVAEIEAIMAGEWHDPSKSKTEQERDQKMRALNLRLNASEELLRQKVGSQKVTALIRQFKAAAEADPKLFKALYAKRDPYRWLARYWAPNHQH